MAWTWVTTVNAATGFTTKKKVWVPDAPKKKTGASAAAAAKAAKARAAARRRARLQQQARARQARIRAAAARARRDAILKARARREQQAAYAEKLKQQRRSAYEALRRKQSAMIRRAGLIRQNMEKIAPPSSPGVKLPTGDTRDDEFAKRRQQAASIQASRIRAEQRRVRNEQEAREQAYRAEKARLLGTGLEPVAPGVPVLRPVQGGVKDGKDAKSAEDLLKEEAKRAAEGKPSRPEDILKLQETYEKYSQGVYDDFTETTAALNALLDRAKNTKLSEAEREKAWNAARALYYGDYRKRNREFTRLFGDGTKQGAYTDFYKTADSISQQQREWWKSQMRASLQSKLQLLKRAGEDTTAVEKQIGMLDGKAKDLGQVVDHYEQYVGADGKEHVRPVYRARTLEEALESQEAAQRIQQEKYRAEWERGERLKRARDQGFMRADGLTYDETGRHLVDPQREGFKQQLYEDAKRVFGEDANGNLTMPTIKRAEDLQGVANTLLGEWEKKNPRPPGTAIQWRQAASKTPAMRAWEQARKDYEDRIYNLFGTSTPGQLDRLFATPGVSHGLALLQGGTSAIGSLARVLTKGATGSSQIHQVSLSDLPDHIKAELGVDGAKAGLVEIASFLSKSPVADNMMRQWLETPEGKRWLEAQMATWRKEAEGDDKEFLEGFYGDGDFAQKLDALNAYGSEPTSDDSTNLMFQLLADPTNAIPLKFTTYLARGRYAAELAQGGNKLNPGKWAKGVKDFLTVDEGVLTLQKKLRQYDDVLKKSGKTPQQAAEELRLKLANIKTPDEAQKAFDDWAKKLGLKPEDIHEGQIFNLAEWAATKAVGERGNLLTQAKKLDAELKAQALAREAKKKAREAEQKAAKERVSNAGQEAVKQGEAARKTLDAERQAAVAAEKAQAAAAAGRRAASGGPVGSAPPPKFGKMSEEEWISHVKRESNAVLRSKTATPRQKARARARLEQVKLAEYALAARGKRRTHVTQKAKQEHADRVEAEFGKEAEAYIAPRHIAPRADSARGVQVEEVRSFYSRLRRAAPEDVPGQSKLGPGRTEDYFPIELFDEVEQKVAAAIRDVRGRAADTVTRKRGARASVVEDDTVVTAGRLSDKDARIIKAKEQVLKSYGISVKAYDEARKVLHTGYVQRRTNIQLVRQAKAITAAGKKAGLKNADYGAAYSKLREELSNVEARKQLRAIAVELHGAEPQAVFDEFRARYGSDGELHKQAEQLSAFQRKTLEEAVRTRSGVADLDSEGFSTYLQSENRPPFEQGRDAVRKWLVERGSWTPRVAEEFTLGKKSWSVEDEARFWQDNFGFTPAWANADAMRNTSLNQMFHSDELYFLQMREWGVLDRSMDLKLKLEGTDAKQIEKMRLEGDPALGSAPRRELEEQRRFVVERYGDLVGVPSKDGVKLHAMPWLMYPDEIRAYVAKRAGEGLPDGLIRNAEELDEVVDIIREEMEPLIKKLLAEKAGAPIEYPEIYRIASEIQARLVADPVWRKRIRDRVGDTLDVWSGFNRWLIFSNPSFAIMNAVDSPIKGAWYRASRHGLFEPGLHGIDTDTFRRAQALTAQHLGIDLETTIYRLKQRKAIDYLKHPRHKGIGGVLERAQAPLRAIPEVAGMAEVGMKMRLAREMYPRVYTEALARLKDPELADVWARNFVKDEVNRMWPTAGDGPFEQLFNRLVPFGSYMVKNKVLFLSEALANPQVLNQIDYIGRFIEKKNQEDWEKDHPGEEMPTHLLRRIELPWAPDYYLDLGQFSDATRGLKPLYELGEERSLIDHVADWVRVINPGAQAGIYAMMNALGVAQKTQYIPVLDENGFPTGQYRLERVGWTEPWSQEQPDIGSVFWFMQAIETASEFYDDGFTTGELSQVMGQIFLFNAISTYDRGSALMAMFKLLQTKDREAAEVWLQNTPEGAYLRGWMLEKNSKPREVMDALNDMNKSGNPDYRSWFALSKEERAAVDAGRVELKAIRDAYSARLLTMTPGTEEYRQTKAEMYYLINKVYLQNPAMMKEEVWSKTAAEWAENMADWQADALTDGYMQMMDQRPERAKYKTTAAYNKAVEEWNAAKALYLKTYPQVEERLASGIYQLDKVRDEMNKMWNGTLDRIAKRNEQIEAAKADLAKFGYDSKQGIAAQEQLDVLNIQNELDYKLLNKDFAAVYFAKDDFSFYPGIGPQALKRGITLPRLVALNDFNAARMAKAEREGRLDEFIAQEQYGRDMAKAILYAKGGDVFGEFNGGRWYKYLQDHPELADRYFAKNAAAKAKFMETTAYVTGIANAVAFAKRGGAFDPAAFVEYMKSHPKLLEAYFKRHPEKRAKWARTDAYIRHISVWGKLVGQSRWDEANDAWDSLPQWVKDQYYAKHPEKRQRAQQTTQYLGYMKKWVSLFDSKDEAAAMKYFNSLPTWAKERYFQKHPDQRAKFQTTAVMWDKLAKYFASDKANQAQYLAQNTDLQQWLAQNAGSDEAKRFAILQAYREIPSGETWLRRVFREKYPEIFSAEALGERKLKRVFDTLMKHPEVSDEFEQWVKAIWASYAEMLQKSTPRPLNTYLEVDRKTPLRKFKKSYSAEQASR